AGTDEFYTFGTNVSQGILYRSTNAGATWTKFNPVGGLGYCNGQCDYDNAIQMDPNNANIIYLGGIAANGRAGTYNPNPDQAPSGAEFLRCTDGGNLTTSFTY